MISISNIAWPVDVDDGVLEVLKTLGISKIDIAPSKYIPIFPDFTSKDVQSIKQKWINRGIEIIGFQSLLFGAGNLNLFGSEEVRNQMLEHLNKVCQLASQLGTKALTFGSPRNRDSSGLSPEQIKRLSIDFFRRLGEIAKGNNVVICIEPNPTMYNCNFLTTTQEAAEFVKVVAHSNIKLQLDSGTIIANQEDPAQLLPSYAELVGHIHLSEPGLKTLHNLELQRQIALLCSKYIPTKTMTIEMAADSSEEPIARIQRTIQFVQGLQL